MEKRRIIRINIKVMIEIDETRKDNKNPIAPNITIKRSTFFNLWTEILGSYLFCSSLFI